MLGFLAFTLLFINLSKKDLQSKPDTIYLFSRKGKKNTNLSGRRGLLERSQYFIFVPWNFIGIFVIHFSRIFLHIYSLIFSFRYAKDDMNIRDQPFGIQVCHYSLLTCSNCMLHWGYVTKWNKIHKKKQILFWEVFFCEKCCRKSYKWNTKATFSPWLQLWPLHTKIISCDLWFHGCGNLGFGCKTKKRRKLNHYITKYTVNKLNKEN